MKQKATRLDLGENLTFKLSDRPLGVFRLFDLNLGGQKSKLSHYIHPFIEMEENSKPVVQHLEEQKQQEVVKSIEYVQAEPQIVKEYVYIEKQPEVIPETPIEDLSNEELSRRAQAKIMDAEKMQRIVNERIRIEEERIARENAIIEEQRRLEEVRLAEQRRLEQERIKAEQQRLDSIQEMLAENEKHRPAPLDFYHFRYYNLNRICDVNLRQIYNFACVANIQSEKERYEEEIFRRLSPKLIRPNPLLRTQIQAMMNTTYIQRGNCWGLLGTLALARRQLENDEYIPRPWLRLPSLV